jgi:hypothetical protein
LRRLLCSSADAHGCDGGRISQLLTDLPELPRCPRIVGRLAGGLRLAVTPVLGARAFHLRRSRQVDAGLGALLWRLEEDTGCLQEGELPPWNGIWQQESAQRMLSCQQVTGAPAARLAVMCPGLLRVAGGTPGLLSAVVAVAWRRLGNHGCPCRLPAAARLTSEALCSQHLGAAHLL